MKHFYSFSILLCLLSLLSINEYLTNKNAENHLPKSNKLILQYKIYYLSSL